LTVKLLKSNCFISNESEIVEKQWFYKQTVKHARTRINGLGRRLGWLRRGRGRRMGGWRW
jgi:hypothetical protein